MKKRYSISCYCSFVILLIVFLSVFNNANAQSRVKKVVLQGFWWDYWNNNFTNAWSNYLTELAPRLKQIGIDGVWIPPSEKCADPSGVGYAPFDAYDQGDKFQKGGSGNLNVRTRMGTKDELLRMYSVMHANGVEVYEDIVLNHVDDAGNNSGLGGQDPEPNYSMQNANGYKNFRYVSYSTPSIDDSKNDYWTRNGRWSKNYENFYPNQYNNCTTGDICYPYFGPDISYEASAYGQSSNIPTTGTVVVGGKTKSWYNPAQTSNYMRTNGRNWLTWYKKQTGADGFRWDAVKHFPLYIQEDYTYNVKYLISSFAQGGEAMFNVGEWIGSKSEIDAYVNNVRSGSEMTTGAFDVSLRAYGSNGGIYSMVMGQGAFNMQNIIYDQQNLRYYDYASQRVYRTCPYVNSHDTFRPKLDVNGNYLKALGDNTGWNTGNELGGNGQHIDPREPRLASAYALIFAVDGNPVVFFEDLFDVGTTGKRFSHLPSNAADLPVRPDIINIIQAHQKLQFKNGDYSVLTALTGVNAPSYQKGTAGNHLVIERTGQAIIGITDNYNAASDNSADQEVWVTASNALKNKLLIDYSGAHGLTTTQVFADGRVLIKTAPVANTIAGANGHGYSIWAPVPNGVTFSSVNDIYNYLATYSPARIVATTQEWEMANDLGDSNTNSLRQGGALPANSTGQRIAGRIFAANGKTITYKVFPAVDGRSQTITLYSGSTVLAGLTGVSTAAVPLTGTYTPTKDGWITIKVKHANNTTPSMKVWVNLTYTAPATVNTRTSAGLIAIGDNTNTSALLQNENDVQKVTVYPNPAKDYFNIVNSSLPDGVYNLFLTDISGNNVFAKSIQVNHEQLLKINLPSSVQPGIYSIRLGNNENGNLFAGKLIVQ